MKIKIFSILILFFTLAYSAFAQSREPVKLDEFGSINCEEYLARMDSAIIHGANEPASRVLVFVYEGNTPRYKYKKDGSRTVESVLPQYGLANTKIRSMKKYLALRASGKKFLFIKAGFRENFMVEMWLVPDGAKQPEPTPTLSKMRYRKGKPSGFCLGCCGP